MKKQKILSLFILFAILLAGCSQASVASQPTIPPVPEPTIAATQLPTAAPVVVPTVEVPEGKIIVLAAASLTESFTEIGKLFEQKNPNTTVEFGFGGSQQLAQQIQQDAPVDVFASASKKYMDAVIELGQVTQETQKVFAENKLVVIYPKQNPAGMKDIKDLSKPKLKLVLAAKEVPVGQYSIEFLTKAAADHTFGVDFQDLVLKNVVSYEDNVKSVLAKVSLGEADAGIVYFSDVTGDAKNKVDMLAIPDALNTVAKYPIAALNNSKTPELAEMFVEFVMSSTGQEILAKYGFISVK